MPRLLGRPDPTALPTPRTFYYLSAAGPCARYLSEWWRAHSHTRGATALLRGHGLVSLRAAVHGPPLPPGQQPPGAQAGHLSQVGSDSLFFIPQGAAAAAGGGQGEPAGSAFFGLAAFQRKTQYLFQGRSTSR